MSVPLGLELSRIKEERQASDYKDIEEGKAKHLESGFEVNIDDVDADNEECNTGKRVTPAKIMFAQVISD